MVGGSTAKFSGQNSREAIFQMKVLFAGNGFSNFMDTSLESLFFFSLGLYEGS